ncbi:hypothetical protein AB5I41_06920 [Sphingomonas sp. MMS24-JH45]
MRGWSGARRWPKWRRARRLRPARSCSTDPGHRRGWLDEALRHRRGHRWRAAFPRRRGRRRPGAGRRSAAACRTRIWRRWRRRASPMSWLGKRRSTFPPRSATLHRDLHHVAAGGRRGDRRQLPGGGAGRRAGGDPRPCARRWRQPCRALRRVRHRGIAGQGSSCR